MGVPCRIAAWRTAECDRDNYAPGSPEWRVTVIAREGSITVRRAGEKDVDVDSLDEALKLV